MMDTRLQRSYELKQALTDFVLDAEGEIAVALETFSAEQMTRPQKQDMHQRTMVVDRFITEGEVEEQSPIDLFLRQQSNLSPSDRQLVQRWKDSFVGLFAVVQVFEDSVELMNWTTAKHYRVQPMEPIALQEIERLKPGEILLTQIAPLTENRWTFFSPWTSLGKLGKPKLAVAIGNFKDNYKRHLYSDAPDLLEEAWKSVERYHQDFVEFFGSDEVTLSGYELNKKIAEFQQKLTQKSLDAAGIDQSKSLEEMAEEAGMSPEELEEELEDAAEAMGGDRKSMKQALKEKVTAKMASSKVELPNELKQAEQVTALSHPRWGQMFLPNYEKFKTLITADSWQDVANLDELVLRYLNDSEFNAFIWRRLAQHYPTQLEALLRTALHRPDFRIDRDLNDLLQEFQKPLEPELPEIASVPIHLHNLFQEAVLEVNKSKSKKKKKKSTMGFQR